MSRHADSAEIIDGPAEIDLEGVGGVPDNASLHRLYETQIARMHGVPADTTAYGRVGYLWEIDERYGRGTYWYFPIGGMMSVTVADMLFHENVSFSCETPDLLCFGLYSQTMLPYFDIADSPSGRTLLGYTWEGKSYRQVVRAGERLDVTSILLMPQGVQRLSLLCHCDPLVLTQALVSLDGTRDVPELNMVLHEIRRAHPSPVTAYAYYEAKITEAAVLLLDWSLANRHGLHQSILDADRKALDLARAYLHDHLERPVTTDELCRVACMSASKLARLFKQSEGTTPQGYARRLRMEHACELLEKSDLSLAGIAENLGFVRQGSFSEAFKDHFGLTPREYRALHRPARP